STNDSVVVIKKAHPWVTLIETGTNLGFTGGNNVGIKKALNDGADFVWLLNNDTIVDKKALSILAPFQKDPRVGVAGGKIYFAPGFEFHHDRYRPRERGRVIWFAGGQVDWANMYVSHRGVDEVDRGQYDQITETPFITGCSMMVARQVFDRVGLLDDKFYLYLEDFDFCRRASRVGFKLLYVPTSVIWHVNAGSSGGAGNPLHEYYLTRNRLLVGIRYAPLRTKLALLREAGKFLLTGSSVKKQAVVDFFLGRFGKQYEPQKFTRQ
ncbi:MAG: glycosyltransferase, partial [Patescibacteria group bacterium]